MSRRSARKHIFNIIFQSEFHDLNEINDIIQIYKDENDDITINDMVFIQKELKGIIENKEKIDNIINNSAVNWNVERIAKVDVAILRIAIYELIFEKDIPDKVSINEAIELAKEFSSDNSPSFINGILGKVVLTNEES